MINYICNIYDHIPLIILNYYVMLAEGTNVFPPDEEDVDNVFSPLREMCNDKVVSNRRFRKKMIFYRD
jgi:hypothetical protein